jgi:hypothetical protein
VIFLENKVNFTLRINPNLRFSLDKIAFEQQRTVTNLINHILIQYVEEYERNKNAKKKE